MQVTIILTESALLISLQAGVEKLEAGDWIHNLKS